MGKQFLLMKVERHQKEKVSLIVAKHSNFLLVVIKRESNDYDQNITRDWRS